MDIDPESVIPMTEVSDSFFECWQAVGSHLQSMPTNFNFRFHNLSPAPPWLEHLCFNLGNQIFFVCIEDVDGQLKTPTDASHCIHAASLIDGVPCVMSMKLEDGRWQPTIEGWGLIHAKTGEVVNPSSYVTPAKVEISDWELQDLAVGYVCDYIKHEGGTIESRNPDSKIFPSLFYSKDGVQKFAGVFAARHPRTASLELGQLDQIRQQTNYEGSYAVVTVASEWDAFDPEDTVGFPLRRGDGLLFRMDGLKLFELDETPC